MKSILFSLLVLFFVHASAQTKDELEIRKLLNDQTIAWNQGSIDDFMKGYWHNDSLMFVGKNGITFGYAQALDNYKKNYSSQALMGQLFFTLLRLKRLSPDYYYVVGKWFLKRTAGDIGGIYTLIFRKINGKWLIVSDHTSS